MRLLAVGLVLLMIAQVELFLQRTGLPFVVVIIDDTRSMNTVDRYDDRRSQVTGRSRGRAFGSPESRAKAVHRRVIPGGSKPSFPAGTLPACSLPRTTASC